MVRTTRPRIVTRGGGGDSTIERVGLRDSPLRDLYHALLLQPWRRFFGLALLTYLAFNAGFAALYLRLGGITGAAAGSFLDAFAFSVQTSTTIGYGAMSPATPTAHALVALQAFLGLLSFALLTGLVFAKFSRPTSRVMFSERAVIVMYDGAPCLMFRMANERLHSHVVEADLHLTLLRDETTSEGVYMRRFHDMKLQRSHSPVFSMSWTAIHPIDPDSPLAGATPESLLRANVELVVSLVGIDETMSQTIHGRYSYVAEEIHFGARLVDVITDTDGIRIFDYRRFHEVEAVDDGVAEAVAAMGPESP